MKSGSVVAGTLVQECKVIRLGRELSTKQLLGSTSITLLSVVAQMETMKTLNFFFDQVIQNNIKKLKNHC